MAITAACNSKRGKLKWFYGAILSFPTTKDKFSVSTSFDARNKLLCIVHQVKHRGDQHVEINLFWNETELIFWD